ncbi:PAPA-1-like conserved region-domain-containing protein [Pseudomassariella vexata]|uniref:PAPA-1-like conserved region-domain-containing protein n=1 Tax=Pseudomassariella vexata TaxID=1141098 RepID=A0A1Y2DY52_9PEZI|nr:PAPA-1-like conserved region-domain-containing protein [Pseudomassariella vexata]ORY64228.1 PAPA-1-like conserved region-domain-containing protein [Pseudomassariella vexata]
MASRPRRAAAQKANTVIADMADSDNNGNTRLSRTMSSRNSSRRSEGKTAVATVTRGPPSLPSDSNQHIHVTVKLPASKLCQAISNRQSVASREGFVPGEIVEGKRNRNQKKSYVVDSSDDEDEDAQGEEDEDAEGDDDDVVEMGEDDVEGEIVVDDTMDIDADGDEDDLVDEDAEGEDDDMVDLPPPQPTIKVSKPTKSTPQKKIPVKSGSKAVVQAKDSDDEELSELESEEEEIHDTVKVGGMGAALGDDDAEGEEDDDIEAAGAGEEEEDDDLESDDDTPGGGSRAETPDLTKMTKRQRARFEDGDGQLMKLSDEVQAKKHFTAEELSMRRSEMARRRRNLSDKRNEEVKMETINKLLKKQAPKISRKAQLAADEATDAESQKPNPVFVRWISTKEGNRVAVPDEMLAGPTGKVFIAGGLKSGKMVEEVS